MVGGSVIELLKIEDLGVIAHADLPLGPGFTAITGETGAGKTMVITALGLLMGERSDAGAVRAGAKRARVSGFLATNNNEVRSTVEDAGGEIEGTELSLVRTVSAEGRSRASVGGAGAPAQVLQRLAPHLFALHGQSEQLRLKSAAAQRETLDRFGGERLLTALKNYSEIFEETALCAQEIEQLQNDRLERVREAERLRLELEEIFTVDPQPGEIEQLRESIERLGNIEELRVATEATRNFLSGDENPQMQDATALISAANKELERASLSDSNLSELHERLTSISVQLDELARELADYSNSLDFDGPAELAKANSRLESLMSLTRKYGDSVEVILQYQQSAAERLSTLDSDDLMIEKLTSDFQRLEKDRFRLQKELSALRAQAAEELSKKVTEELKHLALPNADFQVVLTPTESTKMGAENIEMLLKPHAGATPRPISKGASGGELSRVMLAIEVALAGRDLVPTFVFDEVDAGVGGSAAIEIGRRLAKLAKSAQVIVVTHLAQVAAFADNHLLVEKDSDGEFTKSSCKQLAGEARLSEMARLLSGISDSKSALEHAAELLTLANKKS
ncbi:MAG TPA: DNA repair protein RecN [Microbacteriaceae bacterium]|nr:DNA repair protein RecN [Microbacteriaceae bacterium]